MIDRFHDWFNKQDEEHRIVLMVLIALPIITAGLWVQGLFTSLLFLAYTGLVLIPRIMRHKRNTGEWLP